jgi:hypothetical protein
MIVVETVRQIEQLRARGRDVFSPALYGKRISAFVAPPTSLIALKAARRCSISGLAAASIYC